MSVFKRLLERRFLNEFLEAACHSLDRPLSAAVVSEGQVIAAAGSGGAELRRDDPHAIAVPLKATGRTAGYLVIQPDSLQSGTTKASESLNV